MPNFPYLEGDTEFPHIGNVDVYKYRNEIDYERFTPTQMYVTLCDVPWDMGEAHIGARTISGIGNVVHFGTKAERDAWFAAIPDSKCHRFETKYKELHRDGYIDVPVPFDMCARFNYLMVEYSLFANDDSPLMYEGDDGVRKWFWFVREVEMLAPNTTRLHLMDDAWQTWIYDVNISGMMLERGHAPLFEVKATEFLQNPIGKCTNLLTEDVNYGTISQVKHVDTLVFNEADMMACVATSANPTVAWGTKNAGTWKTPAGHHYTANGQPSYYVFAMEVADLNQFLTNIDVSVPQFKQTVKGVFFASERLLTLGNPFTFASTTCYPVASNRVYLDFVELGTAQFGYDSRYSDLAKLYTSPYAHIEITDENGNVDIVRVEDTPGYLDVSAMLSIAYPFVTLDAHVIGAGGMVGTTVTYRNVTSHDFEIAGQWYETLRTWEVPTFAVVLDPSTEYDYSTHFDRAQAKLDYQKAYANAEAGAVASRDNAYDVADTVKANADASATTARANENASSDMAKANADASANTAYTNSVNLATAAKGNADDSADLITDNATLATTANTALTNASNASADRSLNNTTSYNFDMYDTTNAITNATATSQIQAQEQQAAISAGAGAASAAVGAVASAATGNIAGAISTAINGLIGAGSTLASADVAIHLTQAEAAIAVLNNQYKSEAATDKTDADTQNQKTTANSMLTAQNALTSGQAANASATAKGNALRTQQADNAASTLTQSTELSNNANRNTVEKANALATYTTVTGNNAATRTTARGNAKRTYDTAMANAERDMLNSEDRIENGISQAALREPFTFGEFSNGQSAATKPMALFANIVTQSKAAISAAGDEFLRYGYALDRYWEFDGNWCIGKYFTYWKVRDFWVSNLAVPDMYMDRLRFFLFGGVTIWRRPEDIGKHTIYENWS